MKLTKPPSGMRDFLPNDIARRDLVLSVIRTIYDRYGFVPLETPAIENLSTLLGKYGEEGDQLLYRILHRRDNLSRALTAEPSQATLADEGLRYDLTVPLARVVAQYELPKFFKRYQIQPVWRADRPGTGRFREFYQCDVDITGTQGLIAEAEVCGAVAEVLQTLGFKDFKIRLNHRQLLRSMMVASGIDQGHETAALVAVDKLDKIGDGGVREELAARGIPGESANILMELILMAEADVLLSLSKHITDSEGVAAIAELHQIINLLSVTPAGPHVSLSLDLARGLGYYTGAIFEITVPDLAGSLGGGGRYDNLVGMFGKKQVPAVGFSLGLERILVLMEERGMFPQLTTGPDLLLCWLGIPLTKVLQVAHHLREQRIRVEVYPEAAPLRKQLEYANAIKVPVAGILGTQEWVSTTLTLKDLQTGQQHAWPIAEAWKAFTPPA